MSLQEQLVADLKEAMRKGDRVRQSVIRMTRAAIHNAEIERRGALEESDILGIIAKEAKQRKESIAEFTKGNRQDLVDKEEAELKVLLEYLPEQMSREEVVAAAWKLIEEVGARGLQDKGKVMPRLIAQLKGRAEGREINEVVTELLSGG